MPARVSIILFFLFTSSSLFAVSEGDTLIINRIVAFELVSGDGQYTRSGNPFQKPVILQIRTDSAQLCEEIPVRVIFLDPTSDSKPELILYSDTLGLVEFIPADINAPGLYTYLCYPESEPELSISFSLQVRRSSWVFILIMGLLGGLGLFLLGMNMMSEGMQNSAGNRMRNILSGLTKNRFVALGLGALVTMVIQSSSATNVMLVSFVNSRLMRFKQTIGIILGAAIGTTITAQIIAFKITDYALLFIALGLGIQFASKRQGIKELGKAILGFGVLFFGMHIMSESMYPLRNFDPFLDIVRNMQNPVIGILVGIAFTALIQSSSAFIGILIILTMQDLLTLQAAIPLLIGANVGTSVTAILASLNGSREAKQVALAHTLFKIVGAILILFLLDPFTRLVMLIAGESSASGFADNNFLARPRQIANAHTIYNVALCLLFIPFVNLFARFITWIFPSREEPEKSMKLRYIDDALLKAPVVAMDASRQELIRMMQKVYLMTDNIILPFLDKKQEVIADTLKAEAEIDFLRDNISAYLMKISQNDMAADIAEEAFIMMNAVREFEHIADVISKQLTKKAVEWCESDKNFSEEGRNELVKYHRHTLTIIAQAIKVYKSFDLKAARRLKILYKSYRKEYFEMEQQHYDRLKENIESTHASSKTHLEIITLLRVVSSHATNTSRILLYKTDPKNRTK